LGQCPLDQRIEADAALDKLDLLHGGALGGLEPLASRYDRIEAYERPAERYNFTEVTARIRVAAPQCSFGVLGATVIRMGPDGADVGQAQHLLEAIAITHRLAEQLVRVEEQDRRRRIDPSDLMQQHDRFGCEGGDDGDLPRK